MWQKGSARALIEFTPNRNEEYCNLLVFNVWWKLWNTTLALAELQLPQKGTSSNLCRKPLTPRELVPPLESALGKVSTEILEYSTPRMLPAASNFIWRMKNTDPIKKLQVVSCHHSRYGHNHSRTKWSRLRDGNTWTIDYMKKLKKVNMTLNEKGRDK